MERPCVHFLHSHSWKTPHVFFRLLLLNTVIRHLHLCATVIFFRGFVYKLHWLSWLHSSLASTPVLMLKVTVFYECQLRLYFVFWSACSVSYRAIISLLHRMLFYENMFCRTLSKRVLIGRLRGQWFYWGLTCTLTETGNVQVLCLFLATSGYVSHGLHISFY